MQTDGSLLHVPAAEQQIANAAVDAAVEAFNQMGGVSDAKISDFYELFASTLADDASSRPDRSGEPVRRRSGRSPPRPFGNAYSS